jgi:hypothetical protein
VPDLWAELDDRVRKLAGGWPSWALLASVVFYVTGYLSLRFQLTFLGVGTDLAVVDERYFYAGAQFAVYLVSALPLLVLLGLVAAALGYLASRLVPAPLRAAIGRPLRAGLEWWAAPLRGMLAGIALAVIVIQSLMRQPFAFANLLVADALPGAAYDWMRTLLIAGPPAAQTAYFAGLVGATGITGAVWLLSRRPEEPTRPARLLQGLLAALGAIQILLLPVNYALLAAVGREIPKVGSLGDAQPLPPGQEAWLVWEGKEGVTYLVRQKNGTADRRVLLTLPRQDVKRIEIIRYDPLVRLLFSRNPARLRP